MYSVTCNFATLSIIHLYPPLNKHYYFSPHTLHCNTYLQAPYRPTLQLSATYTCQLITLENTPPSSLQESSKSYAASNDNMPVCHTDCLLPLTSCTELKKLLQQPHSYHSILMWAACCLVFLDFYAVMNLQYHYKQAMTQPCTCHKVIFLWTSVTTPR